MDFLFWQPASFSFNLILFFFSHWFLWVLIFGLSGWFFWRKRYWSFICFWGVLVVSEAVEMLAKHFSPWSRPFYARGITPPSWFGQYSYGSFPSGHAIRSVIVLYFLWQENKKIFWLALPGVMLVDIGRVLFGLHYPVDILGGLVLGYLLVRILNPKSKVLNKLRLRVSKIQNKILAISKGQRA